MKMNNGFYPALGTPTTPTGELIPESFNRQIEQMIASGAQGVLCMGSMGKMASIRDKEYASIARRCCDVVAKRVPVMVGVMDCSVSRVIDRITSLGELDIDGVVATAPYYNALSSNEVVHFFSTLAKKSRYPLCLYDLPGTMQTSLTFSQLESLVRVSNIVGIKTGNLSLVLELLHSNLLDNRHFSIFYSNLDSFGTAISLGIKKNLDGMFTCTPYNTQKMYKENNDATTITHYLSNILKLRNILIRENVLAAYSYAMELLDCPGNYHPDYALSISDGLKEEIFLLMKNIGEI